MTASDLLADLRREHLRLRYALVRVECIGMALSKGVVDLETSLDMFASLPKLRTDPDPFVDELMRDAPPRKTWRRAA